jgi:hypothetical protein
LYWLADLSCWLLADLSCWLLSAGWLTGCWLLAAGWLLPGSSYFYENSIDSLMRQICLTGRSIDR